MELLKFNDAPKSPRRGKNPAGFIGAGIMVAVMGLSSTLAGTITLNAGSAIEFGQGVITAAACDSSIKVTPTSSFDGDTFTVSAITLENIGVNPDTDLDNGNSGAGCRDLVLEIRAFSSDNSILTQLTGGASQNVATVYIPLDPSVTASYIAKHAINGTPLTSYVSGSVAATYAAATTEEASGVKLVISGLRIAGSISKLTVESRAAVDDDK